MHKIPQVVTIAGVDASGGAGLNADLRTFDRLGVYSATVVTGLTAQNTLGVQEMLPTPSDMIAAQFKSIADDLDIQAAKTGALFDLDRVKAVVAALEDVDFGFLVVDPVMVAKGGAPLLSADAIELVKTALLPLATVITPNLLEAQTLLQAELPTPEAVSVGAHALQALGAKNVLIKGGHQAGPQVADFLLLADGSEHWYRSERVDTVRTHGTGDTLAAYLTAGLAKGQALTDIMPAAKRFMTAAIKESIEVGHGHGPLNHWVEVSK